MATQPLFDMSKAQPIQGGAPMFDMSKAQPISAQTAEPSTWDKVKSAIQGPISIPGLPNVSRQANEVKDMATGAAKSISELSAPSMAGEIYKRFTGQSNNLKDLPGKIVTQGVPMMLGEPEADAGESVQPKIGAEPPANLSQPGMISRMMDVAKRRVNHIPGVQAAKDLNYVVRGSGEAPTPPSPPTPKVPDSWGKGQYGTPVDQWGQRIQQYPGAPFPEHPGVFPGAPEPTAPPPEVLQAQTLFGGPISPPDPAAGLNRIPVRGSIAKAIFPGAPLPEAPAPELLQSRGLATGPTSPPDPSAGLGQIPVRGSIAGAMAKSVEQQPPPFQRGNLQELLNKSVGAAPPPNPKAPIYQRGQISQQMKAAPSEDLTPVLQKSLDQVNASKADIPEGHTPVTSSAMKSYKYDPAAREFHARMTSGDTTYVYGDVSPEDAQAFEAAESKGKALPQIKQNPLVAKIVNGKRIAVKPLAKSGAPAD